MCDEAEIMCCHAVDRCRGGENTEIQRRHVGSGSDVVFVIVCVGLPCRFEKCCACTYLNGFSPARYLFYDVAFKQKGSPNSQSCTMASVLTKTGCLRSNIWNCSSTLRTWNDASDNKASGSKTRDRVHQECIPLVLCHLDGTTPPPPRLAPAWG